MPLLSICIPTYNRPLILKEVLESIFSQNVDTSLYEVCVSDNAKSDENEEMIKTFFPKQQNLVYKRSTCEGFMNSIEALKLGCGQFLKLNNDTGKFRPNALECMLEKIKKYDNNQQPVLFFSMANEKNEESMLKIYTSFDDFLFNVSYWSTWSSAFCIQKNNFEKIIQRNIEIDKMFPHTSFLFALTDAEEYVVDDFKYIDTIEVNKKGGYNLTETFGVRYIDMVKKLYENKFISKFTLKKIKKDIAHFIVIWYVKCRKNSDRYMFDFSEKEKYIAHSYGVIGVLLFYYRIFKSTLK